MSSPGDPPPPPQDASARPPTSDVRTAGPETDTDADTGDTLDNPAGLVNQNSRGSMSSFLLMTVMLFMLTNNGGVSLLFVIGLVGMLRRTLGGRMTLLRAPSIGIV